ncbi:hypothetical protein BSZ19_12400 [Bradyrhizobium japonicum]|uniref:Gfo/Idh/MocA-like oxidoreductase N-terminal domain-containing protein n=1 Tax=Bradyrhizobium japonicum TaxID=375 RepID=A0A1Y2JRZ7_BRAJP|nr:hypothetical protein [Bradyrhizobium japonicum]OSJ34429.1 hypothetical protein BSZ19_12400 [Bradyrhizobium japonicum]
MKDLVLVGLGPHAMAKYIPLIESAVASRRASGFHVIELASTKNAVHAFFKTRACKPMSISWVPDLRLQGIWYSGEGEDALRALASPRSKVIVSTEPKAHLDYLRAALGLGLDCLVDKPVVLPMGSNGRPAVDRVVGEVAELMAISNRSGGRCVVMAPRRYNAVYDLIGRYARHASRKLGTPITYIGIEHHEGVWNTEEEIFSRQDHPYRYGYGMLCHSGYHHVDILSSLLGTNEDNFGPLAIELDVHRATAADQVGQVAPDLVQRLRGPAPPAPSFPAPRFWGETDLVSCGAARHCESGNTICLFRLDLLQTSVSLRNWRQLPTNIYNKNGRYASETIRLNIGPFAAIEARIVKRPHFGTEAHPQFAKEARITLWRNGSFLGRPAFRERLYPTRDTLIQNADLGAARRKLFDDWLAGHSGRSTLDSHTRTISLFARYLTAVTSDRREPIGSAAVEKAGE